ncbi:hypothetical protein [Bosea sp. BK604]|nr:hypothetical protein [Bosea sp. BK604]
MDWLRDKIADFALWRSERNEKAAAWWLSVWRRFRRKFQGM